MLRFLTAGESHGPALTGIIEGLPAGLKIDVAEINNALAARQSGYGRGGRMKIERDKAMITGGLRGGVTLGSPLAFSIENKDYANWSEYMHPTAPVLDDRRVVAPRPGHSDFSGVKKYGFDDVRNVLERASARETATRVVVGSICSQLLGHFGISIAYHVVNIGGVKSRARVITAEKMPQVLASGLFMLDEAAEKRAIMLIDKAREVGESLGGIFEIAALGLPMGLGSYVHWDRRLDARLSFALMGIQAVKGVEFGKGFALAETPGSKAQDEIFCDENNVVFRNTNNAGGIEGGMSNGEPLIVRCVMKPIPTMTRPLRSVDINSYASVVANTERSDVCAVPAAAVVGAGVVATVLADEFMQVYGADSLAEMERRWNA